MAKRPLVPAGLAVAAVALGAAIWSRDFSSQSALERNLHEYAGDFWEAVGPVLRSPLFLAAAVLFAASQVAWWRRSPLPSRDQAMRVVLHATLLVYGGALLALTTFPVTFVGWHWERLERLIPGRSFQAWADYLGDGTGLTPILKDILGNVVAFVPVGLLLPLGWERFRSLRSTVLTVAVVAGAIEAFQLICDAEPSSDDFLLNLLGAAMGYGAWRAGRALMGRPARRGAPATVTPATSGPAPPPGQSGTRR